MLGFKSDKSSKGKKEINLFKDYPRFYTNIFGQIKKATDDFFQNYFELKFIGLSSEDNILFYGDEYFVNKIPVNKQSTIEVRISSDTAAAFLDNALGSSEKKFYLNKLTDIEAMLIKAYTMHLYNSILPNINKAEQNKKIINNSPTYNFTFYIHSGSEHIGKLIITIPEYLIQGTEEAEQKDNYTISDFQKAIVEVNLAVGMAKITLEEIKALEKGDIIVLDESDINKMAVLINGKKIKFKINPNPSLIISIDNNRGDEMEEETDVKSQNMWDSILVDIVAEFNNVKLTLGELKQISEGLVIDVGSVYDNKVKLRVENQVVAAGELVILNDRYGVRINEVLKSKEGAKAETQKPPQAPDSNSERDTAPAQTVPSVKPAAKPSAKPAPNAKPAAKVPAGTPQPKTPAAKSAVQAKKPAAKAAQEKEGNEDFDYSDFEI